jgi:polysaccharide chain length determinant protein (PEP-CTERM system associated)
MATGVNNTLSIFSLLEALRRRKLLVIIPTLLLTAGFTFYAYTQPDKYRAEALIAAEHLTPPDYLKTVAPPPVNMQEHLWIVREVLFRPDLLSEAARETGPYSRLAGSPGAEDLEAFKKGIDIRIEGEHTFYISYEGTTGQEVANVTNRLAELFVTHASAKREQQAQQTSDIVRAELDALTQRLAEQDLQIKQYKQSAVNELPEHVDANIRMLDTLQHQFQTVSAKIADEQAHRTAALNEIRELEARGVLDTPIVVEKTPAEIRLEELRLKYAELQKRYTPLHPEIQQTEKEIASVENTIASSPSRSRSEPSPTYLRYIELKSQVEGIDQRLLGYQRELSSLSDQTAKYQLRINAAPQHEKALADLMRENHVGQMQFHALKDKQLDASLAQGLEKADSGLAFNIVEAAMVPDGPYSPKRERVVLLGLCAGLGLGLLLAFCVEQNDTTFSSVDDFQGFTTLPVAAVVPNVKPPAARSGEQQSIVTISQPDSVAAEQYRMLALKIHQQADNGNSVGVMVTSAAGDEGKSLTATNVAVALASSGEGPVLLVDADMRKPRIHEYLEFTVPAERDFLSLLQKPDDELSNYIVRVANVDVIGAGRPSGNPVAALSSSKARRLFERFRQNYKFVIVDAPPTLPIADSHILSGLCDKVVFVVRARRTPRELFQHAVESFDSGNVLGAVLNDVDYQRSRYAYAYEYYKRAA